MKNEEERHLLGEYQRVLSDIRGVLEHEGVHVWCETLDRWISQLSTLTRGSQELCEHLHRSWFATGGMGSLGDIVLAAYKKDRSVVNYEPDQTLTALVHRLFRITEDLSRELRCPKLSRSVHPKI